MGHKLLYPANVRALPSARGFTTLILPTPCQFLLFSRTDERINDGSCVSCKEGRALQTQLDPFLVFSCAGSGRATRRTAATVIGMYTKHRQKNGRNSSTRYALVMLFVFLFNGLLETVVGNTWEGGKKEL